VTGVVLVVATKPDAVRVRARWGERFPELKRAVVLSYHQPAGASSGVVVRQVYVDEIAYAVRDRRYLSLLQRLHSGLVRTGSTEVPVRLLPRLAENPVIEVLMSDLICR
jgi:hypothetical protein